MFWQLPDSICYSTADVLERKINERHSEIRAVMIETIEMKLNFDATWVVSIYSKIG